MWKFTFCYRAAQTMSQMNVSESGQIVLEKVKGVLYDVNHTKSSNLNAHCSGSVMELPLLWSLASRYMSHNRHTYIKSFIIQWRHFIKLTPILQVFFGHPTEFPSLRTRHLNLAPGRRHSLDISASKAIIRKLILTHNKSIQLNI